MPVPQDEITPAASLSRRDLIGGGSLAAVFAGLGLAARAAAGGEGPADAPAVRESLKTARAAVTEVREAIIRISREVWANAAVGLQEHDAMGVHVRELEAAGFKLTARRAGGHPTAFVAEWSQGEGGPKLGFLSEYDALPGLGNAAEAAPKPAANGRDVGHACGHNCLGAGCTGAALALKAVLQRSKTPGTLRVYGCGAEENLGAKVFMAKAGLFDDLDAALAWHSAPVAVTGTIATSASRKIRVSFKGKTAHAGNTPWDGRSALDAAELFTHGVNLMREHLEPSARLHYVYESAGVAPNVVPEDARVYMMARDATTGKLDATVAWLRQLADGAALGTQTKVTFTVMIGSAELVPSETLARRLLEHMQHTPLDWSDEEQSFAKSCQKALGAKEVGLATKVLPFINDRVVGGSTDVADVSWIAPTGIFGWPTLPLGVSLHSWPVTACGGMSIGDRGSLAAAGILAAAGLDLLTDPELRAAAKSELQRRLGGRKYVGVLDAEAAGVRSVDVPAGKGPGEEIVTGVDGA